MGQDQPFSIFRESVALKPSNKTILKKMFLNISEWMKFSRKVGFYWLFIGFS